MNIFFSIAHPVVFIALAVMIIIIMLYVTQFKLFIPLKHKHANEKKELELKNTKLLSLFATFSPNPLFRFQANGEILMTSASGQEILGTGEFSLKNIKYVFNEIRELNLADIILNSQSYSFISQIREKNYSVTLKGLADLGFGQAYCTDITEQIQYEEKLLASESKLREFAVRLQDANETTKNVISMELHDGVCQTLVSLKLTAGKLEKYLIHDEQGLDLLETVLGTTDAALSELKSLSYCLTPKLLQQYGLIAGVSALIKQIETTSGLKGQFQVIGSKIDLLPKLEINLYRIVQELISNIIKHAQASFFSVQFIYDPQKIILIVENDGQGFDVESKMKKSGLGLLDITERVAYFNGVMTISSGIDTGTETIIEIPLDKEYGTDSF
jgi:signal transduction histidine kinase